tara:strand:+ start:358 stop:594 length:237 start_codon:yes stop_codon:yes gene_type:complete
MTMKKDEYEQTKDAVERMIEYRKQYLLMIKEIELAIGSGLIKRDLNEFKRLLKETKVNLKECEIDIKYWQEWLKQHTH